MTLKKLKKIYSGNTYVNEDVLRNVPKQKAGELIFFNIGKWISDDDYNGEYPNFQLQGTPNNIILHFQRFFGENQFEIKEWLISGVNYVMEVYGYKYGNSKPVSISYELDNPNYDELADLLRDEEGVIGGGKSLK